VVSSLQVGDGPSIPHLEIVTTSYLPSPASVACPICSRSLQDTPQSLVILFLCRHVAHAGCVNGGEHVPVQPDPVLRGIGMGGPASTGVSGKIAL
jgi:hypothetical protein